MEENALLVAEENDPALYRKEVILKNINFINPDLLSLISAKGGQARLPASGGNGRMSIFARVRYRQPLFKGGLEVSAGGGSSFGGQGLKFKLIFEKPQKFVASGQSAVFYQGNPSLRSGRRHGLRMLGGGVIV